MSVDWIKMRVDLLTCPKVVRIASGLKKDRLHVIGGLFVVWSIFDAHSEDGILDGYTTETMDAMVGLSGFSAQMEIVNWLIVSDNSLAMPRFDTHNGKSAKKRVMDTERKRIERLVTNLSENKSDKSTTREEKRREEKNIKETCASADPGDENLARMMFVKIREVTPLAKEPNYLKWSNTIRLMRGDGRTLEDIQQAFLLANKDQFWRTNILSPEKLLKQIDRIEAQLKRKPMFSSEVK